MAKVALSEGEKTFIIRTAEKDIRIDGRNCWDYRSIEVETGVSNSANGSARLKLANSDILVGVKTEIDKPDYLTPDQGKIEFFVDCSANASLEFDGRGGETLAVELTNALANAYDSPLSFDLTELCILPGQHCWKIYVDIMILECGGNLYDAVSLAIKAALYDTKVTRVTAALLDAGEAELILSDDPYDCTRINVDTIPILVTVAKIGDVCVVDPTAEEELCATATVVIGVSQKDDKSFITNVQCGGKGSLNKDSFDTCVSMGCAIGKVVNENLTYCLKMEEERLGPKKSNIASFLR